MVLGRTASLIQATAEVDAVPELLLEFGAIARSFRGPEGAVQTALHLTKVQQRAVIERSFLRTARHDEHVDLCSAAVAVRPRNKEPVELGRPEPGPGSGAGRNPRETSILS